MTLKTDVINEQGAGNGVTIEGILNKDGGVTATSLTGDSVACQGMFACGETIDSSIGDGVVDNYVVTKSFTSFTGIRTMTLGGVVAHPSGTIIRFYNGTVANLTFAHAEGTTTATNQFRNRGNTDFITASGETASYIYGQGRWNQL